jgi:hypothetical protein
MQTNEILEAIDQKISQLQQARALLTNQASQLQTGKRRGRPKSSDSKTAKSIPAAAKTAKRTMSAEGKARIAAAQKARWAAKKKATKSAVTKSAPAAARKTIKSAPKQAKKSAKKTAGVKSAPVVKTSATEAVAAGS